MPAVTRNNLIHTSTFWQDCISLRPFLNGSNGLNEWFYPFYRGGKIAIRTGPTLFWWQGKNCYTTSPSRLARHTLFQDSSSFCPSKPKANHPETMKDRQTCYLVSSRVILSPGHRRYCGSFLWKWMKNNPFLDTSFLFSTKTPNDPDFWSDQCVLVKKRTLNFASLAKHLRRNPMIRKLSSFNFHSTNLTFI